MALLANRGAAASMPDLAASNISWNGHTSPAERPPYAIADDSGVPTRSLTKHQLLQETLRSRSGGGPREQIGSVAQRLRQTRSTEIVHSSMEEPLSSYKSLEPFRPHQPGNFHRYHLNHGIRVKDQDTCVVESRDVHRKTKKGLSRESSGTVTYSDTHRRKVELEVTDLTHILHGGVPGGAHHWTPKTLQRIFRERTGRHGIWSHYEIPFKQFLLLFPKTFELFGPDYAWVRLQHVLRPLLLDVSEDAMCRLACARQRGYIEQHPVIEGTISVGHNEELEELFEGGDGSTSPKLEDLQAAARAKTPVLPELQQHRMKAGFKFKPHATC